MKKVIIILAISLGSYLISCTQSGPASDIPIERQREYANVLYNQQLYRQAINEYRIILSLYSVDNKTRSNINYTIANIYFENIGDYINAITYYLKVKHLFQESDLIEEVDKKIVACLERSGRKKEAASILRESASLTGETSEVENLPGDTVAIVADELITMGDLDRLYQYFVVDQNIDPDQQGTKDHKTAFLMEYIKSEVLYNSAKRESLDEDKDVMELIFLQKKQIMIDKLLQKEIYENIQINDSELQQYYDANKDKLTERLESGRVKNLSFEEAKDTIYQLIFMQKVNQMRTQLVDELIDAQKASIFADKIK
ncbi:MAG: hypothetical protein GY863_00535 [bacterium]|nr:hypothetical protein [bacterium]